MGYKMAIFQHLQSVAALQVQADTLSAEAIRVKCEAILQQHNVMQAQHQQQRINKLLVLALLHAYEEHKQHALQLQQARAANQYDALTQTPNRNIMRDRIQQAISSSKRQHKNFAILFIDLDNFKPVNDQYGHAAGDIVLQQVATRLTQSIRDSDTLSRYGGDEFLVLLPEIGSREDVKAIAEKMVTGLADTYLCNEQQVHISASIGIAMFPQDGSDMSSLVKHADTAMYCAKRQGGNAVSG
ncbi:hypothetical protein GCM10008111_16170 [Alishewanella tabrizica]|uniref:GGDEF domain-containing protein n=2 Tax=Alishewanella tabrizica TaxID=671278 RepID=A0ABQ2WNU1_9ALTE|nr:hypothetical protein GCM10008111_16170 [Alishewanella tabrizica]